MLSLATDLPESVFIGLPSYDGRIESATAGAAHSRSSKRRRKIVMDATSSLLALNFNQLWCAALNLRATRNIRWFAMLHGDIIPDGDAWLDQLITEASLSDADVVSAVVPIKDRRGLTSTAIENPNDPWVPFCRLTLQQVNHPSFPKQFDGESARKALGLLPGELRVECPEGARLMVNTGCLVCRFDRDWVKDVHFETRDRIALDQAGQWQPQVQPEDWLFSRAVQDLGVKVVATTRVTTVHKGANDYESHRVWGLPRDHITPAPTQANQLCLSQSMTASTASSPVLTPAT